jgi:hypothetical protein
MTGAGVRLRFFDSLVIDFYAGTRLQLSLSSGCNLTSREKCKDKAGSEKAWRKGMRRKAGSVKSPFLE